MNGDRKCDMHNGILFNLGKQGNHVICDDWMNAENSMLS
jgi:hypothetical protein